MNFITLELTGKDYDDGDYNVVDVPQTECNNDFDELQAVIFVFFLSTTKIFLTTMVCQPKNEKMII